MNFKRQVSKYGLIFLSSLSILLCIIYIYFKVYTRSSQPPETAAPPSIPNRTVLYISSYTASFEKLPLQLKSITKVFAKERIGLDHESYDYQHFKSEENKKLFYDRLRFKISNHKKYDAVLVSDDPALEFVIEHQDELFKDIPVVFFSIRNIPLAQSAAERKNMTGKAEVIPIEDTLNIASVLNRQSTKVVYIYDQNPSSYGFYKQLVSLIYKFPQFQFRGIDATLFDQQNLIKTLKSIPEDTIFLAAEVTEDKDKNIFFPNQMAAMVSGNLSVPVFTCTVSGIGAGYAGGKIVNIEKDAETAASIVVSVLNGTPVDSIPLDYNTATEILFDRSRVKVFNLHVSRIPEKLNFVNGSAYSREPDSDMAVVTSILFISLIVLLITVYYELIQDRHNEISLKDTQREILFRAEHDFLTKLPNRQTARTLINQFISSRKDISIFMIDIDDFKNFNDFFTHACGDAILRTISNRFINLMLEEGIYASRFGGDEFLVVHKDGILAEDSRIVQKVRAIFDAPVIFEEKNFTINASIGIANYSPVIRDSDELISNADIAMYEAKKQGKNCCIFFRESMKKIMQDSNDLIKLLEDACNHDGFEILYQPQINVDTQEVHGYEALVRLKDSKLSPSIFIPIAEESGLINKIDRIVTKKVIQQLAAWRDHGVELKRVSINYSYAQIGDTEYPKYIDQLLKEYHIDSSLIGIEITEGLFIKNKNLAKQVFDEFAAIGVTLSLDDFGTGYSSLSYLTYLPVETVKIDKSLIDNYLSGNNDEFIKNIARLIHSLDMKLTVEGVEFHWQFEKLKIFHCDYIQGYFFSKPITADEVEHWTASMAQPGLKEM